MSFARLMLLWVSTLLLAMVSAQGNSEPHISTDELLLLREETREAFLHAYDSYMKYGFPHDELMPLSCRPRRHDQKVRGTLDDVLGGYMLTLVDSLDSLIVMREYSRFKEALVLLEEGLTFDRDVTVSVFEANIRVLGGLLSAHQLASVLFDTSVYDGEFLLNKAKDLGDRLLPAFNTRTGVPIHLVNLKHGLNNKQERLNCPAAGASFLVEMGLLSRLTGDPRYETAGKKAVKAVWDRRSSLNLIGAMIDTKSGAWTHTHSGIGAGIDSFFETLFKSHILLGDMDLLEWFEDAYDAVQYHTVQDGVHVEVQMSTGKHGAAYSNYVSALQAFWPGLQVLAGDVDAAEETFDALEELWSMHGMLPDMFDAYRNKFLSHSQGYPLRPELIESAYHLFTATGKQKYVVFVKEAFHSIQNITKTDCGYAAVSDVRSGRLDDRMDSYFLAETLMYSFLLFDEALPPELRTSIFCNVKQPELHTGVSVISPPSSVNLSVVLEPPSIDSTKSPHISADDFAEDSRTAFDVESAGSGAGSGALIRRPSTRTGSSNNRTRVVSSEGEKSTRLAAEIKVDAVGPNLFQHQCIQKVSTLFTTEGHLLVIDPIIRPMVSRHSGPNGADLADRHTCIAPNP